MTALPGLAQERVEITGSRIKTIEVEGISPVTVIDAKEIKVEGLRNVESLLNNLPQVLADQGSTVANGATGTATVDLRGIGPERTLVLVNGRRMMIGSPVQAGTSPDLNQIPAGLIRRVEVLTGGASAVYGSDAVAGVVNFIMNDRFEGVQLQLNHSFYNHSQQNAAGVADIVRARGATNPAEFNVPGDKSSDGKSTDFSVLLGGNFANNKGNATVYFSYKKDDALLQSERDFSACSVASSATGFVCGGSGTNATGRITNLTNNRVFTTADANGTARTFANATDQYNFGPLNYFQRPSERYGFNAYANYEVSKFAKVYGEFSFHDDHTVAQIAPGGAFGSIHTVAFDNPLLSASWRTALGLVNPGDTTDVVLQRRNVEGGGRQSEFRNTSFRNVVGVKGDVGPWSYDGYLIEGRVLYTQNEKNYFLTPRIARAMDVVNVNGVATCRSVQDGTDPACVPYNPWRLGGVTQAQLDYLQTPGLRKGSTELSMQGFTASADLSNYGLKLPTAKDGIGVAIGLENRREKLSRETDASTAAGDLSGSGGPTAGINGQIRVKEVFGEVRVPIMQEKPFADVLNASLSARSSKYEKFNTDTWGVGMEWAPVKQVRLRGSVQRTTRAPNLIELFTAQGNNLFDMESDPCAGETPQATREQCARTGVTAAQYGTIQDSPADQYNFLQGGNPNLRPERGESKTFGIVLSPMANLNLSVDYFDIKVKDNINIVDPTTTLSKCLATGDPVFCGLIQRDRLGTLWLLDEGRIVATNTNIGSVRTNGLDFGASYTQRLGGMGTLGVSFVGTLLKKHETEEIPGDGSYDCVGLYGANKCGTPRPEWRHKLRFTWQTPWSADVSVTWRHLGEVEQQETSTNPLLAGPSNPVDRLLGKRDYLDLAGTWNVTKNFQLLFGVNNLLDKDPPITAQLNTGTGNGNTYPGVYDSFGRRIFFNATYTF
ncbi:TonB-dependent receptor [Aquincola sp. S2]|uniref:TonB-dependent receptor n=1 Tax=Pseudaquabacterium terrae TaxID=2732868 RepID=A0ABX2EN00_9BURK|nr:TonB-dependent receptor [Aquabacterium terrae]NRF70069.1 TonB-dependent receptor [Aquabacterium terrae]